MQKDFDTNFPSLNVQIIGINEVGRESNNAGITAGRDLPWLQDVDADGNGVSDVWYDLWDIEYRDVVTLDESNGVVDVFNLTANDLEDASNFGFLRQTMTDTAATPPESVWQSPIEPLDVNMDQLVAPLDALLVINAIQDFTNGVLPSGGPDSVFSDRVDITGDNLVAPLDALLVINHLTKISETVPQAALSATDSLGTLNETHVDRSLSGFPDTEISSDVGPSVAAVDALFAAERTLSGNPAALPLTNANRAEDARNFSVREMSEDRGEHSPASRLEEFSGLPLGVR